MKVKNWTKFQHFKDRRPPWIKLYRDLLDDVEWHGLDPKAAKCLTMLWLIASEDEGRLPPVKTLAFRLRMSLEELEWCLERLGHWLDSVDIKNTEKRYQADVTVSQIYPAAEVSVYQETETEKEIRHFMSLSTDKLPTCPQAELLKLYKQHLPMLRQPRAWEGNRAVLMRARWVWASRPSEWSPNGYKTVLEGVEWWGSFFEYIAKGTTLPDGYESQGRTWRPDLEWILNASNFQKIVDGKYNRAKR